MTYLACTSARQHCDKSDCLIQLDDWSLYSGMLSLLLALPASQADTWCKITSLLCQNYVTTSCWRINDVILRHMSATITAAASLSPLTYTTTADRYQRIVVSTEATETGTRRETGSCRPKWSPIPTTAVTWIPVSEPRGKLSSGHLSGVGFGWYLARISLHLVLVVFDNVSTWTSVFWEAIGKSRRV